MPRNLLPLAIVSLALASPGAGSSLPAPRPAAAGEQGSWIGTVSLQLRQQEYHLVAGAHGLTAPNRAQALRSTWREGRLEMRPRLDRGDWRFTYQLVGWGRPGDRPATPALELTGESVVGGRLEWWREGIREWYVNDERGVEQGFVIDRRPEGRAGEPLMVAGRIEGLLAYPSADGASVLLRTAAGQDALRLRDLHVLDARGEELPACFTGGDGVVRIVVDDRHAVYPVTIDPLFTDPSWVAEGENEGDQFGYAVRTAGDVNGDGFDDVIVGAREHAGRAYVYHGSASGLALAPAWTVDEEDWDGLGSAVSSAGDVDGDGHDDVIVGAPSAWPGGRAYLYLGSEAGLATTAAWTAQGSEDDERLGTSVSTAGDVNGDGFGDVLVGSDASAPDLFEGRARLYLGSAAGLQASPAWSAEGGQASAHLGESLGAAGDVNGDGYGDVIVAARAFSNGEQYEGRAYVYHGSAAGLAASPDWTVEGNLAGALFGDSVSTAGDVNGDGFADVVVGAPSYSQAAERHCRAFVYLGSAAGLATTPSWSAEHADVDSDFGGAVAAAGDVDGDGFGDLLVGAQTLTPDGGPAFAGGAFLYRGSPSGPQADPAWSAVGEQAEAGFGSVGPAGDVDGDGYSDVIVGSLGYADNVYPRGRAYLYRGAAAGLALASGWSAAGGQADSAFGISSTSAGDVNGDGYSDVLVGALYHDNGQTNEGAAFLYLGSAAGLAASPSWRAEGDQEFALFGYSARGAGDVNGDGYDDVVIGAYGYDGAAGAAFVYHGSPAGLLAAPARTLHETQAEAYFGAAVAGAGDVDGDGFADIVVGALGFDGSQIDAGRAAVYHGSASGIGATPARLLAGSQAGAAFGAMVASAGDVNGDGFSDLMIGAPGWDGGQVDEGRVAVYHGSASGIGATPARTYEADQAGAALGWDGGSLSTAGDVNGDGYSDALLGAYQYDDGTVDGGKAWLYLGSASGLGAAPAWSARGDQDGASLGYAVAAAGDVDGDGYGDILIGAQGEDGSVVDGGRVDLYLGSASGPAAVPAWSVAGEESNARFGIAVGAGGDVNGDGAADVLIGASRATGSVSHEGQVFLHYGNGGPGLACRPRQTRPGGAAPLALLGAVTPDEGFGVHLLARSPFGRGKVRLEVEVEPPGLPFDGNELLVTPYADTGAPAAGGSVVELAIDTLDLPGPGPYRWRARLHTRSPFPWRSPWRTPAGNTLTESDLLAVEPPGVGPMVVSDLRNLADPTRLATVTYRVTFSETVTGVDVADFCLTSAGLSGTSVASVTGSGAARTVTVRTGTGSGSLRLDICDNDSIRNLAGNPLGGVGVDDYRDGESYTVDKTKPSLVLTTPSPTARQAPIPVTATFTEPVTGFVAADVTVTNATVSGFTAVTPSIYTFVLDPTTPAGTVTTRVLANKCADLAGNTNLASATLTVLYDPTAPTVLSSTRLGASPTRLTSVKFRVTFSETVSGVDATDFALVTSGVSGAAITAVSATGATRDVTVATGSGNGTIHLDVLDDDSIADPAANRMGGDGAGNGAFTGGDTYTVDKVKPTVVLASSAPNPTGAAPIPVTATFSEPVTGFDASDVSVTNATVVDFAGSGAVYSFGLQPLAGGTTTARVLAAKAADLAGNTSTASNLLSRTYQP